MSVFSGPQGKGALRAHREAKRTQAAKRQASHDAEVAQYMAQQHVGKTFARWAVRGRKHNAYQNRQGA